MKLHELQLTALETLNEVSGKWSREDVAQAVAKVHKSPEYKELVKHLNDLSTPTQRINGTFFFSKSTPEEVKTKRMIYGYTITSSGRLTHGGPVKNTIASPALTQSDLAENYIRQIQRVLDLVSDAKKDPLKPEKSRPKPREYDAEEGISGFEEGKPLALHNSAVKSLKGSPREVSAIAIRHCHNLVNLEGGPKTMTGTSSQMRIENCKNLLNLKGAPTHIGGVIIESCPKLESLDGLFAVNHLGITGCKNLKSLEGIGSKYLRHAMSISLDPSTIKSHILGLVMIDGIESINSVHGTLNKNNPKWYYLVMAVMDKFDDPNDRAIELQHMLIDEGLPEYAKP